eukprot:TRINITY_DN22968_c0_g1_i1.p1 TRINITY_DN22968_c0_g1~~TRINITY_DN22968_c0_g1_i1.p1  ORF type:complete len:259 (+),score=73.81 TRINITY_DN22968_c0_g1_i1:146-922(+)
MSLLFDGPFRCWSCQGSDTDDSSEVKVFPPGGEVSGPKSNAVQVMQVNLQQPTPQSAQAQAPRLSPEEGAPPMHAAAPATAETDRGRVRENLKAWVQRAIASVPCEIFDEELGALRRGRYAIDDRLTCLTVTPDDDDGDDSSTAASPSAPLVLPLADLLEVSVYDELAYAGASVEEAAQRLEPEQRSRLLVLECGVASAERKQVCVLESTEGDCQMMHTSLKILMQFIEARAAEAMKQAAQAAPQVPTMPSDADDSSI